MIKFLLEENLSKLDTSNRRDFQWVTNDKFWVQSRAGVYKGDSKDEKLSGDNPTLELHRASGLCLWSEKHVTFYSS